MSVSGLVLIAYVVNSVHFMNEDMYYLINIKNTLQIFVSTDFDFYDK